MRFWEAVLRDQSQHRKVFLVVILDGVIFSFWVGGAAHGWKRGGVFFFLVGDRHFRFLGICR